MNTLSPPAETACHPSITAGELNYFVMYVLSLGSLLPMSDFWAILRYDRIDFLECLLVEFPDKKLPYTIEDLILIALFTVPDRNEEKTLKILQLAEKVSPGTIASFSDRYGGNLLWYSLFALEKGKLLVNSQGTVVLSPVQRFLYGLCDHEKPNCDGISFDDLTGSFPNSIL
ncbi:MAG: hypothetical protein IJS14_02260 [Lentisphaeria bacterium]|nr:hypothetical protein [Lentisphaeria bacterium]